MLSENEVSIKMKKILMLCGGWDGHRPDEVCRIFKERLEVEGCAVEVANDLNDLDDLLYLKTFDLIFPCWTVGELKGEQEKNLDEAISSGVGLAGVHGGITDSIRSSIKYQWMTGGQFLGHPYTGDYTLDVIDKSHPSTEGLESHYLYNSEQYYMSMDPGVEILVTTKYNHGGKIVEMPVVWHKKWGEGRVFHSTLGHDPKEFIIYPELFDMAIKGVLWARR